MTKEEKQFIAEVMEIAQSEEGARMADEALERFKNAHQKPLIELKEADISKVLKMSYIADRFFGRSRSWLCHKLNHNIKNGKPDDFTEEERETLKDALETIAMELQELADNM